MRFKLFFFLIILMSSCNKKADYNHIQVIGHGGMGLVHMMSIYHDNSFEAVELALQFPGINGVEVDVQMDLDGELWLCHDIDLSSVLGVEGSIPLYHTEFLEQQSYQTFYNEKLCKLREVIPLFNSSQQLFIDIKSYNQLSEIIVDPLLFKQALDSIFYDAECQVSVILVNGEWVPDFVFNYDTYLDTDSKSIMDSYLSLYPELAGLVVPYGSLLKNEIKEYKDQNWKVFLYEMRSPRGIRMALRKNPTGILPDDIRRALIEAR